jgi:hypothetical protein
VECSFPSERDRIEVFHVKYKEELTCSVLLCARKGRSVPWKVGQGA